MSTRRRCWFLSVNFQHIQQLVDGMKELKLMLLSVGIFIRMPENAEIVNKAERETKKPHRIVSAVNYPSTC